MTRYPLAWAEGVVRKLEKAHARASNIVYEMLGEDREDWAKLLASGSPSWHRRKELVHLASKLLAKGKFYADPSNLLVELAQKARLWPEEVNLYSLDNPRKSFRLKQQ